MALYDYFTYYYESITPPQAAILLSVLFLYVLHLFFRDLDVPPGPKGIPLLGYWPFLKTNTCHMQLRDLTKKYGDVFSFRVTGRLFIHLASFKAIKEAHLTKADCFDARFTDHSVLTDALKDGLIFLNGEQWKVLRRFFLLKFKEYGMTSVKENTSCSIYDSLVDMVKELYVTRGRPFKIADLATTQCTTTIRKIIFNDGGITEEELKESNHLYTIAVNVLTSKNFLLMGNFAKFCILPLMPKYWSARRCNNRIDAILSRVIERQKAEFDDKRVSNIIDAYLKEREDRQKKGDPTAAYFTDKALVKSLAQIVSDGIFTVSIMVGVFLSILVEHPEEQDKIYQEIINVIGSHRLPEMNDKSNMPYTNAFMYEVMRYTDFFPLYPSLICTRDTTVCGYKIPEGSITLVNLYAIHRNPETYDNPDEFNPSRFLSTPRPDLPILFGIGKRSCTGEAFSMMEIFLFLTTIVQNFHLSYPEGSEVSENMFWSEERVHICAVPRLHA